MDYPILRQETLDLLNKNEARDAYLRFRDVLIYPGQIENDEQWIDVLDVFAQISSAIGDLELEKWLLRALNKPDDPQILYKVGYQLIESRLSNIAATVLAKAYSLSPGDKGILSELCIALEDDGLNGEAARFLKSAPEIIKTDFMCRYLLAFNSIMSGDLTTARDLMPGLETLYDPDEDYESVFMANRIKAMLQRADAVQDITPLDQQDLRGWHYVLTGSILLHLSPHGFDEGMNGRYAGLYDNDGLCLEGLKRLAAVLEAWEIKVPRVFAYPNRRSRILANAAAKHFGCPVEDYPAEGTEEPGLIVAYDLFDEPDEVLNHLSMHQPGQILWGHACCWTENQPFAADFTTLLYQMNTSPWDEHPVFDPDTREMRYSEAREARETQLAEELLATPLHDEALEDLPVLLEFVRVLRSLSGDQTPAPLCTEGRRLKQWMGGPVPSNRFI